VRRGGVGAPFYRVGGEQGGRTGKGIGRPVVGRHYWPSDLVGRGNGGVEWGVNRGECGAVSRIGGDVGVVRTRDSGDGCVRLASSWGRRKPGGAHTTV
jgi:hypothetical protein